MNKLLLTYLLTIGICGVAGGGTGIVLKRTIGPIDEHYPPGFDPKEFSNSPEYIESLMTKYEKLSDKTINGVRSYSDTDVITIVLEKYRKQEYCWSIATGNANTIVTQTIRNAQIKSGDEFFEEQLSYSSVVDVANRTLQHGVNGNLELYKGGCINPEVANYSGSSPRNFSKDAYKDYLGKTLDEMFIYIISDKTVLESSRTVKGDEGTIKFSLNPNLSTFYYKTQMKNISGLSNLPPFSEVKLEFTYDTNLNLKKLHVDETFTATKEGIPVPATTHNIIDNYYHAGEEMEIPAINENINYSALLALEED